MSGAINPLPQYTFMVWSSVKAQGQLHLYLTLPYINFHILHPSYFLVYLITLFQLQSKYRMEWQDDWVMNW